MENGNRGPVKRSIPGEEYKSCMDCKFYKQRLFRSGRDPIYHHTCAHISAVPVMDNNLPNEDRTPDWCPVAYPKMPEFKPLDPVSEVKRLMKELSGDQRVEIIRTFCIHCGDLNPGCQCWNDD